jgi:16S rRNA processing protein RimM
MPGPTHLVVGHVGKPHGTRGELLIHPLTDHPERTFAPGVVVRLAGDDERTPDPDLPPLRMTATRPYGKGWLVFFGGVEDRDDAGRLRGRYLLRPVEEVARPEEGEVFYHEMLEMSVETVEGRSVGRVTEVFETQPADLLEVRGPSGTLLVPFTRSVVVQVDRDGRRIVVDPPEGLLDL